MISPDIWQDPWFGKLTHTEQIFYIGIISNCDDEGRILAESPYLRSRIFIYQDMPIETVENMLTKFKDTNKNFLLYNVNGSKYICLLKWRKYQKPDNASPSNLPPPPTNNTQNVHSDNESPIDSTNVTDNHSDIESPPSIVEYSIVKDSIVKDSGNPLIKPLKHKYGEFKNVLLTDNELNKLETKFGKDKTKEMIEKMSLGIESKGYKYKSHYAAILNWDRMEKQEGNKNGARTNQQGTPRALPTKYTEPEEL